MFMFSQLNAHGTLLLHTASSHSVTTPRLVVGLGQAAGRVLPILPVPAGPACLHFLKHSSWNELLVLALPLWLHGIYHIATLVALFNATLPLHLFGLSGCS